MDPEIDIIVTDDNLTKILPLGKQGCDNCAPLSYYCDECTRKIYAAQQSMQRTVDTCPECGGYFNQVVCEQCGYH
jgi:DNA-directed RNA polymerase subunit RPC12/RpoP